MTNQDTSLKGTAQARHARNIVEFMSALLMAVATIASAWCGYKSTSWNGQQSILVAETAALRFEATRKLTLAGQEALVDITTFEQLYRAMVEGRTEYVQRTLKRLPPRGPGGRGRMACYRPAQERFSSSWSVFHEGISSPSSLNISPK